MALDFMAWPKIARLNRGMVVTEKIDGTNAAVIIESHGLVSKNHFNTYVENHDSDGYSIFVDLPYRLPNSDVVDESIVAVLEVGAQSRNRLLKPEDDNFGFAQWVWVNSIALAKTLGEGRHFGEWWGSGIQRGYGLQKGEKRFSLFNVKRYGEIDFNEAGLPDVATVPVLWIGAFDQEVINMMIKELRDNGSFATDPGPRFDNPEGVVVYHVAANTLFKVLCENDEMPKGLVEQGAHA